MRVSCRAISSGSKSNTLNTGPGLAGNCISNRNNYNNILFILFYYYLLTFTGGGGSLNIFTFLFCIRPLMERILVLRGLQSLG